jgi:hypothetical protein
MAAFRPHQQEVTTMPAAALLAFLLLMPTALAAETPAPRFQAVAGAVAAAEPDGDGGSRPATVLLDTWTGQTWVLDGDGALEWRPVPFSAARPMRALPRLDGEPMRLGR